MFKEDKDDPERVGLISGIIPKNNRTNPFSGRRSGFSMLFLFPTSICIDIRYDTSKLFVQDWFLCLLQEHPTSLLRWHPGLRRVLPSGWRENRGERLYARLGWLQVIFVKAVALATAQGLQFRDISV